MSEAKIKDINTLTFEDIKKRTRAFDLLDVNLADDYLSTFLSAQKRDIGFELSFSEFKRIKARKICQYSGVTFAEERKNGEFMSIDRIDPDGPYSVANSIACTAKINTVKNMLFEGPRANYVSIEEVSALLATLQEMGFKPREKVSASKLNELKGKFN